MSTNSYQLYLENTRRLARTIVIKSAITAQLMNEQVKLKHGTFAVDEHSPETWRYYQHVSGEYHPTDEIMVVKSWDTTETIIFSKDNLAVHRATARAYAFGTKQFDELIARYPNQDLLILGILYPADKNYAITAPNYSVLAYPKDLIEDNEYGLIERIEIFTKNFMDRWYNQQYIISDDLYAASVYGVYYLSLYLAILNFRLEACKTAEVHSFHINQYLLSNGIPERTLPYLTKRQALFLYRNIKYIRTHAGKNDTLYWLVENLFTERNLPLSKYTMRHYDTELLDTLYPTVLFKNTQINSILGDTSGSVVDLNTILRKEYELAEGNIQYIQDYSDDILGLFETANSSVIQTKVLESATTDYTNSIYTNINKIFMSYWPYLAKLGIYQAYVGFTNSRTGERILLTAADAFLLLIYTGARALNYEVIKVPPVFCERVLRLPIPTVDDYLSVSSSIKVSEVEYVRQQIPIVDNLVSVDAFNQFCREIQLTEFKLRKIYTNQHHHFRRAEMKAVVYRSYTDTWIDLEDTDLPYSTWLASKNINFEGYTQTDFAILYNEIYNAAVGADIGNSVTLADIQEAMSTLLLNLSSYSIQIVNQINDTDIIDPMMPAVRVNNDGLDMSVLVNVPLSFARAQSIKTQQDYLIDTVNAKENVGQTVTSQHSFNAYTKTAVRVQLDTQSAFVYNYDLTRIKSRLIDFEIIFDQP